METYILDTNLLFNMEAHMGLGETSKDIMASLTEGLKKATRENLMVMAPPRIIEEIKSFFEKPDEEKFLNDFLSEITVKSPSLTEATISAQVMALYIEESRERGYRGMNVGEEEIAHAGAMFMGTESLPKKEFQITIGKTIKNFRDRYRNATRTGFIDSLADFDLIMLAKEQNGFLVSTDEGVIRWGRMLGVKEVAPTVFGKKIQAYL
jgi:hypothetical protein